jgi:predicted ester cyclase
MPVEENKALVYRLVEEINKNHLAALPAVVDVHFVDHNPFPGQGPGLTGLKHAYTMFRTAFPDWQVTAEDMIAEGDKVVIRSTWRGRHNGEFLGIPPTDEQFTVSAIDIVRIVNGKIVERWGEVDLLGILQQLGVIH